MNDITSDDKLWALLAYILSPLVPIIILLMEDKKNRPFIKYHNVQALILGVIEIILSIVIGWTLFGLCVPALLWFYMVYLGIKAYQGEYVVVPFVTDFAKKQGWA
jgi:uncharacterized membrane protein